MTDQPRNPIEILRDHIARSETAKAPDLASEHDAEFRRVARGITKGAPAPAARQPVDLSRLVPDDDESDDDPDSGDDFESDDDDDAAERATLTIDGAPVAIPAGLDVGPAEAAEFTAFASRNNLTRAQAQALLEYERRRQKAGARAAEQQEAAWRERSLRTIPRAEIEQAQAVLRQHGDRDIEAFLNSTGFGSHPTVIKLLGRIARGGRAGR